MRECCSEVGPEVDDVVEERPRGCEVAMGARGREDEEGEVGPLLIARRVAEADAEMERDRSGLDTRGEVDMALLRL